MVDGGLIANGERFKFAVEGYLDTLRLLAQQTESRLSDTCMEMTFLGNETKLDYYGSVDVIERPNRHDEVDPTAEISRQRRSVEPDFFEYNEYFDPREDLLTQALMPDSQYREAVLAGFMRKWDDLIIDAYLSDSTKIAGTGTAHDAAADLGPGGGAAGSNRVDRAFTLVNDASDLGSGSAIDLGLTPDKVIAAVRRMAVSEVGLSEKKYVIAHPLQVEQILTATQNSGAIDPRLISADYNTRMALEMGMPTMFMGCEWRQTTRIASATAGDFGSGQPDDTPYGRFAFVVTEDAVACFKAPSGMTVTLDRVPHRGNSLLLQHHMPMATLRIEGKRVCPIECDQSVA